MYERKLRTFLTEQKFEMIENQKNLISQTMVIAQNFAYATKGIAVLSDFLSNNCHTFAGDFGQNIFGLPEYSLDESDAFERIIFDAVKKEDLLERHVLELQYLTYLKTIPIHEKTDFQAQCLIRFEMPDGREIPVLHTTRYVQCLPNGSVWLGLCTYIPFIKTQSKIENGIVNIATGDTVPKEVYAKNDTKILTKRQVEILSLLSEGRSSKQISDSLNISVYTVNRHRQDIMACLKAMNTAAAVEIGLRLHLI